MQNELRNILQKIERLDERRSRLGAAACEVLSSFDSELWEMAVDVLESEEEAATWLVTYVPALDAEMPLRLVLGGKRDKVVDCLYQIEHGGVA